MQKLVQRIGVIISVLAVVALGAQAAAAPRSASRAAAKSVTAAGGLRVVASGLDNPRGIGFGPDGALYVAEAGSGGSGPCGAGPGGDVCFGRSGAVSRITRHSQRRVLTGLPSVAEEGGVSASGPVDLGFSGHSGYLLIGHPGGGPENRRQFGPGADRFGKLLRVDRHGIRAVADFPRFEAAVNPDQGAGASPDEGDPNSNPNGLLVGKGAQLVTDAGGNDLLKVDHKGRISVVAVFPVRLFPAPPGIPGLPPELPVQSVPTSVVKGPDGAYYVGELTGFPFPVGGARVYPVVPGHRPRVFAGGFTNIIDIAFDQRGRLYVLEIARNGLLGEDLTGQLVRVNKDGSRTTLASEGLFAPGGFVLGHGAAYITNNSIFSDTGQVVKVAI